MKHQLPRALLIFIISCLLPFTALAAVDNSRFQEANAAYSQNDFTRAITIYETLLQEHGLSVGVLYNLANSYAQAGSIGKAVLNYERALKLSPNDSDIIGNLQLVRTRNSLFTRDATLSERFLHLLNMNQWVALGGLSLVTLTCTMLLSLWYRFSTRAQTLISICCFALMAASIVNTVVLRKEWASSVITSDSRLQISPFEGAMAAGNIQEGRMVYPGKQHGDYVFVEDETGRKGWIQQSVVEPVIPIRLSPL